MSAVLPLFQTKRCSDCRKDLPLTSFVRDRRRPDGRVYRCIACTAAYYKIYGRTEEARRLAKEHTKKWLSTAKGRGSQLFKSAKRRSELYGHEFDLSREWVIAKVEIGYCEVSGIKFDLSKAEKVMNPFSPSIDRIDNRRGYLKTNCRVICWALNAAFSHWGEATFAEIAKAYLEKNKLR